MKKGSRDAQSQTDLPYEEIAIELVKEEVVNPAHRHITNLLTLPT